MAESFRLVLIEWVDSCGAGGEWQSLAHFKPEQAHCRSVGWLIRDDRDYKVVAPHLTDPDSMGARQFSGEMTIPTVAIVKVVNLKTPKSNA